MPRGIIYLIQPYEFLKTNIYKIGMSNAPSLKRCKSGYRVGTRYLHISECEDPLTLEQKIKNKFNTKFKLVQGREYFSGNESEIYQTFTAFVSDHNMTTYK